MTIADEPLTAEEPEQQGVRNPAEWATLEEILDPRFDAPEGAPPRRSEREHTASEALTEAFRGASIADFLPIVNTIKDVGELEGLHRAQEDYTLGIADADQMAALKRVWLKGELDPGGWAGAVDIAGHIFREAPAFMGEMAGTAAIGPLAGKAGAAAFKASLIAGAREAAERSIMGKLSLAAKGLGTGALVGVESAVIETAIGSLAGGGRLNVNILQRTLRGMDMQEDEAGHLAMLLDATKKDFLDVLPEAILDTIIEPVSERSGGALMQLPILDRIGAFQAAVVKKLLGKGYTTQTIVKSLARRGAWHGFASEMGEEFYGDAWREASGRIVPGAEDLEGSLSYTAEEIGGMMLGMGAISGVGLVGEVAEIRGAIRRDKAAEEGGIPDWARDSIPNDDPDVMGVPWTSARGEAPEPGSTIRVQTEDGPVDAEVVGGTSRTLPKDMVEKGEGLPEETFIWVRPLAPKQAEDEEVTALEEPRPAGAGADELAGRRRFLHPDPLEGPERTQWIAELAAANEVPDAAEVVPDAAQEEVREFWESAGVDVVFVDLGENTKVKVKAINPRQGVMLVSAREPMKGPESIPRLLGHEFIHELAKVDMPAFSRLHRLVQKYGGKAALEFNEAEVRKDLLAAGVPEAALTPQRMREESLAYQAQNLWETVESIAANVPSATDFIRELQQVDRGLWQQLLAWLRKMARALGFNPKDPIIERLRAVPVNFDEVGTDPYSARNATLQAAAMAEALQVIMAGRPTPSSVVEPQGPMRPDDGSMGTNGDERIDPPGESSPDAGGETGDFVSESAAAAAENEPFVRQTDAATEPLEGQGMPFDPVAGHEDWYNEPEDEWDETDTDFDTLDPTNIDPEARKLGGMPDPETGDGAADQAAEAEPSPATPSEEFAAEANEGEAGPPEPKESHAAAPKVDPAPGKGKLIPTRGPDGGVVWTTEPVGRPTILDDWDPRDRAVTYLREAFLDGEDLSTARKFGAWLEETGFEPLQKYLDSLSQKEMEELIEESVVQAARVMAKTTDDPAKAYAGLVDLYARQPRLTTRTSSSAIRQAYSTPAPLAYVASRLGRMQTGSRVFEPTAGTGMLLIDVEPGVARVNELDPDRAAILRRQGFHPTSQDATAMEMPTGLFDRLIANPPFGALLKADGSKTTYRLGKFKTREIDQAIALRSLEAMASNGRAVLILGGKTNIRTKDETPADELMRLYGVRATWAFYTTLYKRFNVVEHVQVSGKLYERQGAAWPVDVIVIDGKNPTGEVRPDLRQPPYIDPPRILRTWDEVGELLNEADSLDAPGARADGGSGADPAVEGAGPDVAGVPELPGGAGATDDVAGGQGGPDSDSGGVRPEGDAGTPEGDLGGSGAEGGLGVDTTEPGTPDSLAPDGHAAPERGVDREVADAPLVAPPPRDNEPGALTADGLQIAYRPFSKGRTVTTLLPANQHGPAIEALADLESRVGDIDSFVARKLEMTTQELVGTPDRDGYFSGEQVDALALTLDQMDRGKAFVIGDQTGVGKGRYVAGIIRYAIIKGWTPIFATKSEGLYNDIYRDLYHTGIEEFLQKRRGKDATLTALVTNLDLRGMDKDGVPKGIPIPARPGKEENRLLESGSPKEMKAWSAHIQKTGTLPPGFDVLLTTYSQMQPYKGNLNLQRHQDLRRLVPNGFLILDESHNAVGGTQTTRGGDDIPVEDQISGAAFVRGLLAEAKAAVYSSATFAKNPKALTLYFRTELGRVFKDGDQLEKLLTKYGVPFQQIISRMLTATGQFLRREKDFTGIKFDPVTAEVDMDLAERMTGSLRTIYELDLAIEPVRKLILAGLRGKGKVRGGHDSAIGKTAYNSVKFSNIMHNVVRQMLVSIKAQSAAERAIAAWKGGAADGEKPVIAVASTFGALLKDKLASESINVGDEFSLSFKSIFLKYLKRITRITAVDENGSVSHIDIFKDLPSDLQAAVLMAEQEIGELDLEGLSASPIDTMLDTMRKAGMVADEITGRNVRAVPVGPERFRLEGREATGATKKLLMDSFNAGKVDALIINRSGSTGFSLHASEQFADRRKRHMIVLEPELEITEFMQMLGRINRTGQVTPPLYSILASPMPAEQRPLAVLMRKMAALNANSTAGRRGAMSLDDAVDFMNVYGDIAATRMLAADPALATAIFGRGEVPEEDVAQKLTGRLVSQPIARQREVLAELDRLYKGLIEEANRTDTNVLEARVYPVPVKPIDSGLLMESNGTTPFDRGVDQRTYHLKVDRKRFTREDLDGRLAKARDGAKKIHRAMEQEFNLFLSKIDKLRDAVKAAEAAKDEPKAATARAELARFERFRDQMKALMPHARAQSTYTYEDTPRDFSKDNSSHGRHGVVLGFGFGQSERLLPSTLTVKTINFASGEANTYYFVDPDNVDLLIDALGQPQMTKAEVDNLLTEYNEAPLIKERTVLVGNVMRALVAYQGQNPVIAMFRTPDGKTFDGLLMRAGFNPGERSDAIRMPSRLTSAWMDSGENYTLEADAGVLTVKNGMRSVGAPTTYQIEVKSRGGRKFYANPAVVAAVGDDGFTRPKSGGPYVASVTPGQLSEVADALRNIGWQLKVPNDLRRQGEDFIASNAITTAVVRGRGKRVFDQFDLAPETWLNRRRRRLIRSFQRIHEYQDAIKEEGGDIDETTDTVQREILMHGRTRARLREVLVRFEAPIRAAMAAAGLSLEDVDRYLYARHAPSRNAVMVERQRARGVAEEDINWAGSGMPNEREEGSSRRSAAEIIEAAHAGEQAAAYMRIGELVDEMMEFSLHQAVRYGLIDDDTFDNLITQWEHYVPLRTTMPSRNRPLHEAGRELGARAKQFERAEGRTTEADSPLAYALQSAQRTIIRGERNRVGLTFLNMLRRNKELIDFAESRKEMLGEVDEHGEPVQMVEMEWLLEDNELVVREKGKAISIKIKDLLVARAMKRLGQESAPQELWLAVMAMRYLSRVITQWDPDFLVRNAMRDYHQGIIHAEAEYPGITFEAWSPTQWHAAWRALARYHKGENGTLPIDARAREFAHAGGLPGYFDVKDLDRRIADIQAEVQRLTNEGKGKAAVRKLGKLMEAESNAIEGAMRLVIYNALRERGISVEDAARFAKELTVNFDQVGEIGRTIGSLYLFWNASAQGIYRSFSGIARSRRLQAMIGGMVGFGIINGALQRMIGGDDEDGIAFYDKRAGFEKDMHLLFMLPGTQGAAFKLPLPYIYNVPYRFGDHIAALAMGAETPRQAFSGVLQLAASVINPFGSEHTVAQLVSPTLLDPFVQTTENKKFHGGPIFPEAPPWMDEITPDSEKVWESNRGDLWHRAARALSWVTGGDETRGGVLDFSPESMKHVVDFALGGVGKFLTRGVTEAANLFDEDKVDWGNVPIARTVIGGSAAVAKGDQSLFYRFVHRVDEIPVKIQRAAARGDYERVEDIERRYEVELGLEKDAQAAKKRVKDLRKEALAAEDEGEARELMEMAREEMRYFNEMAWQAGMR